MKISELFCWFGVVLFASRSCRVCGIFYRLSDRGSDRCKLKEAADQTMMQVGSRQECVLRCIDTVSYTCMRMSYYPEIQLCNLFKTYVPGQFLSNSTSSGGTYVGFKIERSERFCLDTFTYIPEIDTCLRLIENPVAWSEGQCLCNFVHPSSHLLVINTFYEQSIVSKFVKNNLSAQHPGCFATSMDDSRIWTAGQRIVPLTLTRYVWKPYPGMYTEFSSDAKNLWYTGEPNKLNAIESCVHLWLGNLLNDVPCDMAMCSLCQAKPRR